MRADLLRLGRGDPELEALDLDFRHLFASWFNRGFLVLRPINWESPAHILEKIIAYEAVHAIDSWDDLRRRLQPQDRRCFRLFPPRHARRAADLRRGGADARHPGIGAGAADEGARDAARDEADTAVFYSISNCQAGLASISFGNSLIKQVAADLSAELSGLKTLRHAVADSGADTWLDSEGHEWQAARSEQMRALAAHYLLNAKRTTAMPVDPVARFHLGNGAIVHAVHGEADHPRTGAAIGGHNGELPLRSGQGRAEPRTIRNDAANGGDIGGPIAGQFRHSR